jgi:hypothetical protein
MQAPGVLDLNMWQGASWDYTLTWQTGGTAVNLTGYDARMQVRETYDATLPVLSLTAGTGITLGGTAGTIVLEATATQTAAIDATPPGPQQYVYDLELVSGAGIVTRLVEGRLLVYPEVTR